MLRSTRVVVLLGVAVQIVAFLRTAIIAATLGTSPDVDAYNLGLIAPGFISTVVGAWLQMSFIGRYASLIATHETDLAASYRSRMLVLVTASAVLFASLCYLVPEPIMKLFLPPGQGAMVSASAEALKLSGLTLIPIVIGDFLGLVLNGHGRFFAAALAPLANAVVSVLGLRLWPSPDLTALLLTLLAGSLAQGLVIVAALLRTRLTFPLETRSATADVRTTLALALPLLPAMMLSNSVTAIIQFRAAQIGEGAVATYGYASRLHGAMAQVLVMGLSPRFTLDNLFIVGSAFLVAAALAFSASMAGWIGFGVSTGLTVIAATSAVLGRSTGRKLGHGLVALVGLWSLIAALAFSGSPLMWLVFADAIALGVVALADLAAHEASTESVVHRLVVTGAPSAGPAQERVAA